MRIAVLSDIHGNIDALNAVLSDSCKRYPDAYVFLGDLVFNGLYPQACFDVLSAQDPIVSIKGNTDANLEEIHTFHPSNVFEQRLLDSIVDCYNRLTEKARLEIASWPITKTSTLMGSEVVFCHGSPFSFSDKLSSLKQVDKTLAKKIDQAGLHMICCGHTHCPASFNINRTHIVNVGAVGYSFDGDPRASYSMLEIDDKRISHQIIRVDYDRRKYLLELQNISDSLPLLRSIAHALEWGKPMPNWR